MYTDVIREIRDKARKDPKVIVFPEPEDPRVVSAVDYIRAEGIAEPMILSADDIDPLQQEQFAYLLYEMKRSRGMSLEKARELMNDRHFYATMMLRCGLADGMVSGASHATAVVMRAVINCLEINDRFGMVSSCFLMGVPGVSCGADGMLCFADCGVIPDPTSEQLAKIALSSARFFEDLMDRPARVAMLSFSTKGSAAGRQVEKVQRAVEMIRAWGEDIAVDGELQVDSALDPETAALKLKNSDVAGKANVLIFPSLDAGNIGYKLTERLAKARAIGPLVLGTIQPCSDLSRGCSVEDIIDCTAVTVVRAQKRMTNTQNLLIDLDKYYACSGF